MELITIITIVKNDVHGLRRTLKSIKSQDIQNWELLVVSAPSEDGTLELAEEMAKSHSKVKVIKQKSLGIFPAMNEGIEQARGSHIWFMNSGDVFANPKVLELAITEFLTSSTGVVIGGYQISLPDSTKKYSFARKELSPFNFAFSRRGGCHQAMLFKTSLVKQLGGFDPKYKFNADFSLVLRIIQVGGGLRVPEIYADVEPGGFADQNIYSVHAEKHEIRKIFFNNGWINVLSTCWTIAARIKILSTSVLNKAIRDLPQLLNPSS
jgi:glycosyltransferase involved in cell wall biosynthesis